MSSDSEWLHEVRRWYLNGSTFEGDPASPVAYASDGDLAAQAIGYESADPRLQGSEWLEESQGGKTVHLR